MVVTENGADAPRFALCKLVIAVHDLAGFTRAAESVDDLALAAFVDDCYVLAAGLVRGAGGRVVKYLGDACLAVFPPDLRGAALDALVALRGAVIKLRSLSRGPAAGGVRGARRHALTRSFR